MGQISSTVPWPGLPGPGDLWAERDVFGEGVVRLRWVPLWGRDVLVQDPTRRVYCPGCTRLVDVADVGRADNPHAGQVGRDAAPRGTVVDSSHRPDPPAMAAKAVEGW